MKLKTLLIGLLILVAVFSTIFTGAVLAAWGPQTITVLYQDIKIKINDRFAVPEQEPFIYQGTTFVPLRFVSEALGAEVQWDGFTNTVTISKETAESEDVMELKKEIKRLKNRNTALENELEDALDELRRRDSSGDDYMSLGEIEDELNDDFDRLERVRVEDIILAGDEDEVAVTAEVELDERELEDWGELEAEDIADWIEDLVDDIQRELEDDTVVTGEIINTLEDEILIEFEKDGEGDLIINYQDEDYRKTQQDFINEVELLIENEEYEIMDYDFRVDYINYNESDNIEVKMFDVSGEFVTEDVWEDFRKRSLEDDIENICEDIVDAFEDEADAEPERVYLEVFDENWRLLEEFEYDVDDRELE